MVSEKTVKNMPVTPIDVSNSLVIFGTNLSRVKGGTVRKKPSRVETEFYIEIPRDIYSLNRFVTLTAEFVLLVILLGELPPFVY